MTTKRHVLNPWILRVERGPAKGSLFALKNGANMLGRLRNLDISVLDLSVSREHALIQVGEYVTVQPLTDKNPTLVNNQNIKMESELHSGDRIQVGDTVFRLVKKSEAEKDLILRSKEPTMVLKFSSSEKSSIAHRGIIKGSEKPENSSSINYFEKNKKYFAISVFIILIFALALAF